MHGAGSRKSNLPALRTFLVHQVTAHSLQPAIALQQLQRAYFHNASLHAGDSYPLEIASRRQGPLRSAENAFSTKLRNSFFEEWVGHCWSSTCVLTYTAPTGYET